MSRDIQRILILAHSGSQAGAELSLDTILRHLDRNRFEATVLFPWDGPMVESARSMGYRVEVLTLARWMCYDRCWWHYKHVLLATWWRVWMLVRKIRREGIALVYTNTSVIHEGAVAAWLAGVPHVWHIREVLTPKFMRPRMFPLSWIQWLIGRFSDRVIFGSNAARAICEATVGKGKCLTIYNSVRFPLPVSDAMPDNKDNNRCVIAWVGRYSELKNPLMLLHAAARMKEANQVELVFAGEGPLESAIRETADRLGLNKRCRVLAFQPDIRPLLTECDILVLTSQQELFGLVLVEAGAYGKPVVATRTQGPSEVIVDGETGFLVPISDDAALAERLDQLVGGPQKRRAMGQAGAARVAELFSPEKNTRKIEAVFESLLDPGKAAG